MVVVSQNITRTEATKIPITVEFVEVFRELFKLLPNPDLSNQTLDSVKVEYKFEIVDIPNTTYGKSCSSGFLIFQRSWNSVQVTWVHYYGLSFKEGWQKKWKFSAQDKMMIFNTIAKALQPTLDREEALRKDYLYQKLKKNSIERLKNSNKGERFSGLIRTDDPLF